MLNRRQTLLGVATLALPTVAAGQGARVLRMVPQANLGSFDPIFTTADITRNYGFMVYDTLYGMTSALEPTPQMAAGHVVEDDGRRITLTLRDGLAFHDGSPVRAVDVVASLRRWMARNPFGQKLATVLDELSAKDDRSVVFRLQKPFPLLFHALAGLSQPPFIMPERVAKTDPFKQIDDTTGSGPFRFKRDEFNSGNLVVFERNAAYQPRGERPSLTSGAKVVYFERVEWTIITDVATSAAALQRGEIAWFEQPPPEIQDLLRRNAQVKIENIDVLPRVGILRLNHLHPPFDNPALRRAILPAIDQADFMQAIAGTDPAMVNTQCGVFTPGTPNATMAGLDPLLGQRSLDRAKALMAAAGYTNGPMRLIGPTDLLAPAALTQVAGDLFRRLGFNQDMVLSDWGTVIQRRASKEPLDKGGWSALLTSFASFDFTDPALHPMLRGNGMGGWPGWPTIPKLEALRDQWFNAPDDASRRALCADIQRVALDEVAFVPVGAYMQTTALRRNLVDRVLGFAIFWGLRAG